MSLLNAMNAQARTHKGALTNFSSNDPVLDLFSIIGSSRDKDITPLFAHAWEADKDLTLRMLLWVRDIQHGAGERETFRNLLPYVATQVGWRAGVPGWLINLMKSRIARWDDLLCLLGTEWEETALTVIERALSRENGLCAKWMPRKGKVANILRKHLRLTPKEYRKLLVRLSNTVEQQMCARQWDDIEFGKLPSLAAKQYQNAFNRHCEPRYQKYKEGLQKGTEKINAGAIFPHDIVKSCVEGDSDVAEAQWKALPNYLSTDTPERILTVSDVSGSMTCTSSSCCASSSFRPIEACIALTLYLSERLNGPFKDTFITFSASPVLGKVNGSLSSRIAQLNSADWGATTDLMAVFDLILAAAQRFHVGPSEMPTMILILSDMEFDVCSRPISNYEVIKEAFSQAGYELPKIVFWNLKGRPNNVPALKDDHVALVSGFSPSIMKGLLKNGWHSPREVMLNILMKDRYNLF